MRHSEWTRTRTSSWPVDVALDHRDVVLLVDQRPVADRVELAERGRQAGRDDTLDEAVVLAPVGDQIGDRDHLQAVPLAVRDEVGNARHRPVLVHDLADHAGRIEPGEPREVDGRLGLTGPLEDAAGLGLEREHVPRLDQITRCRVGVDRDLNRLGAISGGDARGDALGRLDRDRERRLERRFVLGSHQVQVKLVAALRSEREADQPATVGRHEVDRLGSHELGGHRRGRPRSRDPRRRRRRPCALGGSPRAPPRRARTRWFLSGLHSWLVPFIFEA